MEQINLTNTLAGLTAIQRCMAGEDILFTRLEIGDGILTNTDVSGMTGLINKTSEFPLGAIQTEDNEVIRLRSNISNKDISEDLVIREYGIYAKFGNEQEFLFAYLNVGESTTPLPNERIGRYELNRDFVLYIGNSTHVDFTSNGNLVYVAVNEYKDDMTRKANVVGTIEDLKNSKKYKVGDVVEVLGYYSAGNGADHIRIISKTDDGSGILLANGLYANLVHNGEVNVSWFGAKGDGEQIENSILKKVHDFANENIDVIYNKGVYLLKTNGEKIIIKSNVDFNNATLKFDIINQPFTHVFEVKKDVVYKSTTLKAKIKKGQFFQESFNVGKKIFVELVGTIKNPSNVDIPNFKEYFFHTNNGCCIGSAFADREIATTTLNYRDMTNGIKLENLTIDEYYSGNPLDIVERFHWSYFKVEDVDNFTLNNIRVKDNGFVASRECFNISKCYNLTTNNVWFDGIAKRGNQQGVNSAWGYFINLDSCVDVTFNKFVAPFTMEFTWSSYGMNKCKKITIKDSSIFRVDQHTLCQDILIENSIINSSHLSGDGFRKFKNVKFAPWEQTAIFHNRGESVDNNFNYFDGDIFVENCTVDFPSETDLIELFSSLGVQNENIISKSQMNNIYINGLSFTYGDKTLKRRLQLASGYDNKEVFYKLVMDNVDFSNVILRDFGFTSYLIKSNSKYVGKRDLDLYPIIPNLIMDFRNCKFNTENLTDSQDRRGVTIFQNKVESLENINNIVPKIRFFNCEDVITSPSCAGIIDITNSTIQSLRPIIGSDPRLNQKIYLNNVKFQNCRSEYYFATGSINVLADYTGVEINKYSFLTVGSEDIMANALSTELKKLKDRYDIKYGVVSVNLMKLDTPYMTTKMQSEGVYEDFVSYMDSKLEYDNQQRGLETQRQQAFEESGMDNYDEWLATQPMILPDNSGPVPSDKLLAFKIKYLGE